jgi:dTDP-4-dehydrorhamnose reductase
MSATVAHGSGPYDLGRMGILFVTGGAGFLGRHLVAAAASVGWQIVAPSSTDVDILDRDAVTAALRDARPAAVAHLAYRKDDREVIVAGSRNVADAAATVGARLVHLSTDVVFGGRPAAYTEDDPTGPINDYGRAKAAAEGAVNVACPSAVLVRTSLLYGTDFVGICQTDVLRALDGSSAMSFFSDEVRSFTHAADVARAVTWLAARPDVAGPLHVAGPEAMDRLAFARRVARWSGLSDAGLREAKIAASGLARPANVVLDSSRAAALGIVCRPVSEVLRPH